MESNKLILALFFVYMTAQVQPYPFISQKLVEYITEKSNPDVLPQETLNKPVKVKLDLSILNIKEVDFKRGEVEIDAWIQLFWDGGLTFSPSKFNNVENVRIPTSNIWVPDIAVFNGELSFLENMAKDQVVLTPEGNVAWIPQTRIRFTCELDDVQVLTNTTCGLKLGSWVYSGNEVELDENTHLFTTDYDASSRYELLDTSAERKVTYYPCCTEPYHNILFTFSFRKNTNSTE